MRLVHYCQTCEGRLPYCVRSDRRFCSARCRVWAFRHPGQKRADYTRVRVRLPQRPGQGQPKTLAEALVALAGSRKYAAKLEATARVQKAEEHKWLTEMAKLREGLAEVKRGLAVEGDDVAKTKERLGKAEDQKNAKTKQSYQRLRQIERLLKGLNRAENDAKKKQAELDRAQTDLSAVRRTQERQKTDQESKLREAQSELAELARTRDELAQQITALTDEAEALRNRVEQAEQTLKQRDEESTQARKHPPTGKRVPEEPRSFVELLQRRLAEEQDRRIASEQRLAQLLSELDNQKKEGQPDVQIPFVPPPTTPGNYQRHAATAGYDFTRDPLFDLMRRDVLVADRYADWQGKHMLRLTSRRRDPDQTLDEQAYAATLAARWRLIDHPHLRLGTSPKWSLLGGMLDERSEKYLLMMTNERIEEMQSRIGELF